MEPQRGILRLLINMAKHFPSLDETSPGLERLGKALQERQSAIPPPQVLQALHGQLPRAHRPVWPLRLASSGLALLWLLIFWLVGQPGITLEWQPVENAASFRIYRWVAGSPILLSETHQPVYHDPWALPGLTTYQVEARQANGQALHSTWVRLPAWEAWLGSLVAILLGVLMARALSQTVFISTQRS